MTAKGKDRRLTLGLALAVLSRRHPGQDHFAGLNSEALAGEVLLIKDPGHFAIDSGRLYVVTAAVAGDREGFEGEVFSVTLARESVRAAKFLISAEPAEYSGSGRHCGIGTDALEAFTVFPIAALTQQRGSGSGLDASGRP
jgi:hypothetical protein